MAATIATALKQLIEAAGLGVPAFRDAAPANTSLPWIAIQEGISTTPDNSGDAGDDDTGLENVQIDVWEKYIDDSDSLNPVIAESPNLVASLRRVLHGAILPMAPVHVYGVRVELTVRTVDKGQNTVRTRFSVNLNRKL